MNRKKSTCLKLLFCLLLALGVSGAVQNRAEQGAAIRDYDVARSVVGLSPVSSGAKLIAADALDKIDLEALQELNSEVIGWIYIPDTEINYPLLQSADNEYYLAHTWKKEENKTGAIFLDYRNDSRFCQFNSVIYGHNMGNGSMFGSLSRYRDEQWYELHPSIYILTAQEVTRYDVFSFYKAEQDCISFRPWIDSKESRQLMLDASLESCSFDTGIVPDTGDNIITLVTCTGLGYEERWVVQAVKS